MKLNQDQEELNSSKSESAKWNIILRGVLSTSHSHVTWISRQWILNLFHSLNQKVDNSLLDFILILITIILKSHIFTILISVKLTQLVSILKLFTELINDSYQNQEGRVFAGLPKLWKLLAFLRLSKSNINKLLDTCSSADMIKERFVVKIVNDYLGGVQVIFIGPLWSELVD